MPQFIAYDVSQTLTEAQKITARANIDAEKIIVKKSAFNVDFGAGATDAAPGNHTHFDVSYAALQTLSATQQATARTNINAEPAFEKNTAFNKNFGIRATDVATGNHSHTIMNPVYTLIATLPGKLVELTGVIDTKNAEITAHRKELIAVENQMVEFWKDPEKSKMLGKRYSELEELILEARLTLAEAKGSKGALTFISAVAPEMITTNPNT